MFGWDWVELEHVLAHNLPKEIVIIMYRQKYTGISISYEMC